jgi:hypothetical protein
MLDPKLQLWDSSGNLVATSDTGLTETITTTLAGGTYEVTVSSHGSYGDVGQYTISGDYTTGPIESLPSAPTNLTAQTVSTTEIDLAWQDTSSDETSYIVDRASDQNFATNLVSQSLAANTTTFAATGLDPATAYYFRVTAVNGAGSSIQSNTAIAATSTPVVVNPPPVTPPVDPPPVDPPVVPPVDPPVVNPPVVNPPVVDPPVVDPPVVDPPVVTPPVVDPPVVTPPVVTPPVTNPGTGASQIPTPVGDSSASIMSRLRKLLLNAINHNQAHIAQAHKAKAHATKLH